MEFLVPPFHAIFLLNKSALLNFSKNVLSEFYCTDQNVGTVTGNLETLENNKHNISYMVHKHEYGLKDVS